MRAQARQEIALETLVREQHGVYTAVLTRHGDDLAVVERNAQLVRQHLADRLAARTVLARDGDNVWFHFITSPYSSEEVGGRSG